MADDLYQEENLQVNKDIREQLKGASIISLAPKMPDQMKAVIVEEVKARLVDSVEVDDKSFDRLTKELSTELELVAQGIIAAVKESKPELLSEISIKNIAEARVDKVHVSNLNELEKAINDLAEKVVDNPPVVNVQKQEVKFPNTARDYVSVRLTNGKQFYEALLQATSGGGGPTPLKVNGEIVSSSNPLPVDATIEVGDVQIGAVEIKNSTDDTRATVGSNGLYVDVQSTKAPSTAYNGTFTVPTGTSTAIASSQAVQSVTVKSLSTNTVAIYVGASGTTVANGFELLPGEGTSLDIDNLADIFAISGTASQNLRYIAVG